MRMNSSKFVKQIQKRDIKKMLEGELNDNISYHKHENQLFLILEMVILKRKFVLL